MPNFLYIWAPNFLDPKLSIFTIVLSLCSPEVFSATYPQSQITGSINLANDNNPGQESPGNRSTQVNPYQMKIETPKATDVSITSQNEHHKNLSSEASSISTLTLGKCEMNKILLAANQRPVVSQEPLATKNINEAGSENSITNDDDMTENHKALSQLSALAYADAKTNRQSYSGKSNTPKKGISTSGQEKKIMDKIYVNFLNLLNLSVSTKTLTAASNKKIISDNISALDNLAAQLSEHPKSLDFDFIVKNFQRDTKELSNTWKAGRYRESQFIIRSLTDNCISCHTSQPSINDSSFVSAKSVDQSSKTEKGLAESTGQKIEPTNLSKQTLFQGIDDKNLNLIEKAQLKTALREFSEALNLYETAFLPANLSAYPSLMLEGYFTDYIIVALKVKQDNTRVLATLEKIHLDPSLPYSLSMTLKKWLTTLKGFKNVDLKTIDDIEKFVSESNQKASFPLDSGSIVTNILAVNKIKSLLDQGNLSALDQAKAYLITGVCELSINRPLQISRANYYLEKAITNAPKTDIAKNAYYYLESNIFYENSGSLGVFVPQNELDKLKSLKKLIE